LFDRFSGKNKPRHILHLLVKGCH